MDVVIIRIWDAPTTVKGVTVLDENGDYNIYINSRLSFAEQQKAVNHEMQHITKNHFSLETAKEAEKDIV